MFLLLLASISLASCNPDPSSGPRVDLVGSSRFLSASRSSTAPADTFTTRVFADKYDAKNDPDLNRLLITVEYTPTPNPYIYPATGFRRDSILPQRTSLVYLDSVLTGAQRQSVAFQFTAGTRSTSGQELWTFRAEDANGDSNVRSFRLNLRNPDSARVVYHAYTMLLPAPVGPGSRSHLSLLPGLVLPSYSLRQAPENQRLIDLVFLTLPNGARALAAPNDPMFINRSAFWTTLNRRATELRTTSLDSVGFLGIDTQAELQSTFAAGVAFPNPTRTNELTARGSGRVIAFRTADTPQKTGLIFIQALPTAPTPLIRMQVRITK